MIRSVAVMSRHSSILSPHLKAAVSTPLSTRQINWRTARSVASKPGSTRRWISAAATTPPTPSPDVSRLPDSPAYTQSIPTKLTDPTPDDYSTTPFLDSCSIVISSGHGGNGCVSFLREKYTIDGPPNGGDGGTGGSIFIRAVQGHTSLHKLARQGTFRAGRGRGGMGKSQGGRRGEDVVIEVPVGTVVREIERSDPTADEAERRNSMSEESFSEAMQKIVFYPGGGTREQKQLQKDVESGGLRFPDMGHGRINPLKSVEPDQPIRLDLDSHMEQPMLLAAGGIGGLGNPHFTSREDTRPKIATRGQLGVKVRLELELKLLADVGLVGLPNAGKSTLLRSITNSRTRVGNWAFTTLEPKIGTVVLDDHTGRPRFRSRTSTGESRTSFTVADIPGLIEGAHLDRGLGLGFLRHIERARMLAFVVDLSAGDAVIALQNLWKEVGEYERLRGEEVNRDTEQRLVDWNPFTSAGGTPENSRSRSDIDNTFHQISSPTISSPSSSLTPLRFSPISAKPWFVVATKADLAPDATRDNFMQLREYLQKVQNAEVGHPSGKRNGWRRQVECLPVSAMRGEGVGRILDVVGGLLEE